MKDLKIRKELLSEALSIDNINDFIIVDNKIMINKMPLMYHSFQYGFNIYEFAFKCKEWALSKGYFIYSTHELSFIKSLSLETIETFANGKDTEIECIIQASEWILKQIN